MKNSNSSGSASFYSWSLLGVVILTLGLMQSRGQFAIDWIWILPASLLFFIIGEMGWGSSWFEKIKPTVSLTMRCLPSLFLLLTAYYMLPNQTFPATFEYYEPIRYEQIGWSQGILFLCSILALLCQFFEIKGRARLANITFQSLFLLLGLTLLMSLVISPRPWIDVWSVEEAAARAFLEGQNPYTLHYNDLYPQALLNRFLPFGVILPYMPGVFYLMAPFKFLGMDVRVSLVFAHLLTGLLLVSIARKRSSSLGQYYPALFFLALPYSIFIIQQSWNEGLTVMFMVLYAWSVVQKNKTFFFISMIGMVLIKEHVYIALPFLFWFGTRELKIKFWPSALLFTGICLVLCLPYLIWDWREFLGSQYGLAFLRGNFSRAVPERTDSFGIFYWLKYAAGIQIPYLTGWITLMGLSFATWRIYKRPELATVLQMMGFVMLLLFTFATSAFLNYYWVPMGFFVLAMAAQQGSARKI